MGTLYFAFNDQAILCLVTVAVQACALVYYVASVKHTLQNLLDLRVVFGCADSVPRALCAVHTVREEASAGRLQEVHEEVHLTCPAAM